MDNEETITLREQHFWGTGWGFPVVFEAGDYRLQTSEKIQNINQSIDIILKTQQGERNMNMTFGSGLHQFFFRMMDQTLKGEIIDVVKMSLLDQEPRITVLDVDVEFADERKGLIHIFIHYEINTTNTRHNYVYPFYIKEGTNL